MSRRDPQGQRDGGRASVADQNHEFSDGEIYDRHPGEITVLMGWFLTGHLTRLYRLFDGDMIQLIVLGEIAHHNISPFFSGDQLSGKGDAIHWNPIEHPQDALLPCNSFSVSQATGIPRETCRRKVQDLIHLGFLERHPKGGYVITPVVSQHYRDFDRETFVRWRKVSRAIDKVIAVAQKD